MAKKPGRKSGYKPEYCQMLINHMAEGLSVECFGALCNPPTSRRSVYRWIDDNPEFAEARDIGTALSQMFWEKLSIDLVKGKYEKGNAASLIFNMKNRFGWADRREIDNTIRGAIEHRVEKLDIKELKEVIELDPMIATKKIEAAKDE